MGNVATKERPRSNSVSSVLYSQSSSSRRGAENYHGQSRRLRTNSVPGTGSIGTESYRHQNKAKGKHKAKEEAQYLVLDLSEMVDGGYLQPQGVYPGPHDFKYNIVRQLIIDRKLAPFYKGLSDFDSNWNDSQLLAAVKGTPLPQSDSNTPDITSPLLDNDLEGESEVGPSVSPDNLINSMSKLDITIDEQADSIIIPNCKPVLSSILGDTSDFGGDISGGVIHHSISPDKTQISPTSVPHMPSNVFSESISSSPNSQDIPFPTIDPRPLPSENLKNAATELSSENTESTSHVDPSAISSQVISSPLSRTWANTSSESTPGPIPIRPPPEVTLYKEAIECPICFLFYPKLINLTRCCAQPICTECFVEIKRQPPHPPHDEEPDPLASPSTSLPEDIGLISEPACCPYCMAPDMGVTFSPPPYRTGIGANSKRHNSLSPLGLFNSPSSLSVSSRNNTGGIIEDSQSVTSHSSSALSLMAPETKRRGSLPASSPEVITTDQIRPDWNLKLITARAHAARKSAPASALHASAFFADDSLGSGSRSRERSSRSRANRMGRLSNSQPSASSPLSNVRRGSAHHGVSTSSTNGRSRADSEGSVRRVPRSMVDAVGGLINPRLQELEDMMIMEAVRLSILEEEKRQLKTSQNENPNDPSNPDSTPSSSSIEISCSTSSTNVRD